MKLSKLAFFLLVGVLAVNCAEAKKTKTGSDSASTSSSEQSGGNAIDNFARFDRNHNGYLERREWPASSGDIFSKLDKNHDGKLSRKEYTQEK